MPRDQEGRATRLTPTERDRLLLWSAAEFARRRRTKGLKLNHPEAVALISDEVMERAREGTTLIEAWAHGMGVLRQDDVLDGVADLVDILEVEAVFKDGTKLVTRRDPIQ